jgi:hypothetical protein
MNQRLIRSSVVQGVSQHGSELEGHPRIGPAHLGHEFDAANSHSEGILRIRTAFVPPNAKEFDITACR